MAHLQSIGDESHVMRQEETCSILERAIGKLNVVDTAAFGYANSRGNPAELSWVLQEVTGDLERIVEAMKSGS